MKLAIALRDPLRAAQLEELHSEIKSKIRALELIKNTMEDDMCRKLQETHQRRIDLDMEEKEFLAKMLDEDSRNKSLIGLLLEESAGKIFDEYTGARVDFSADQDEPEANAQEEDANVEAGWEPAVVDDV